MIQLRIIRTSNGALHFKNLPYREWYDEERNKFSESDNGPALTRAWLRV